MRAWRAFHGILVAKDAVIEQEGHLGRQEGPGGGGGGHVQGGGGGDQGQGRGLGRGRHTVGRIGGVHVHWTHIAPENILNKIITKKYIYK